MSDDAPLNIAKDDFKDMSGDIKKGRFSRRILTIIASVLAAALMIAVPIFAAVDTDADLTKAEDGYSVVLKDPTDAQLTKLGANKADSVMGAIYYEMLLFNGGEFGVFSDPTMTSDSFGATIASGQKITSDTKVSIDTKNVSADNVKITLTAKEKGKLISPYISYMPKELQDAAAAIAAYVVDDVNVGDKVEITGDVKTEQSIQYEYTYKLLSDNKCVIDKTVSTSYEVQDVDLTIKMIRTDSTTKEIQLRSTVKGIGGTETVYKYADDNVVVGTKYTMTEDDSESHSGDMYYTVDGKDYSLVTESKDPDPVEGTVTAMDIFNQSDIKIDPSIALEKAALPNASEEGMEIDKTYSGAESAFDGVVMDAVGNDILKLLLIIGGVILGIIVLIIILIIVLIVVKKKKK